MSTATKGTMIHKDELNLGFSCKSQKQESLKVKIAKKKWITINGLKLVSAIDYQGHKKSNKKKMNGCFFPSPW